MMDAGATTPHTGRGPPPGLAFDLDEWVPCEAYLGCIERREIETVTDEELARVIARLHRRHERDHGELDGSAQGNTEVYVKVNPLGLVLRVITSGQASEENDGRREGIREFFETVRIARCSANHQPCVRALLWVYNRQPMGVRAGAGEGRVECHGVVCRDLKDATRLANTLAAAFHEISRQPPPHPGVAAGNAFGAAAGGAVTMSGLMRGTKEVLPPAYTSEDRGDAGDREPLPRRRGRRQVLEVASVPAGDSDDGVSSDLDPRLRLSPGSLVLTSPRAVTPGHVARTAVGDSTASLKSSDGDASSPRGQASLKNSTVSLHSAVAVSERRMRGRVGRSTGGLPDVAADPWESFG